MKLSLKQVLLLVVAAVFVVVVVRSVPKTYEIPINNSSEDPSKSAENRLPWLQAS